MRAPWKRIGVAAIASLAIVGFAGSASAQHHHGGGGVDLVPALSAVSRQAR